MEFVNKDADMVLVNTSPEELKKLAAIMRACHSYDPVLCEMDSDDLLDLADRLDKAEQDSWVFHDLEILYLYNILIFARSLGDECRSSSHYFNNVTEQDIVYMWAQLKKIDELRHLA